MCPSRIRFNEARVLPMNGRPVPAADIDSYQRLEKRSHRQVWTGRRGLGCSTAKLRRFRRVVDNLRCRQPSLGSRSHRAAERPQFMENTHEAIGRHGPAQEGKARVNRWRCACTLLKAGARRNVCLAVARVDAQERSARFMNAYERQTGD
jgi:hypothetical protein